MGSYTAFLQYLQRTPYSKINIRECRDSFLDFLHTKPTVADLDIDTIKAVTKTAAILIANEPDALDGWLGRVIRYHQEGIELLAQSDKYSRRRDIVEAHLHSHMADFLWSFFSKTGSLAEGRRAIYEKKIAGDILARHNNAQAFSMYRNAAAWAWKHMKTTSDASMLEAALVNPQGSFFKESLHRAEELISAPEKQVRVHNRYNYSSYHRAQEQGHSDSAGECNTQKYNY